MNAVAQQHTKKDHRAEAHQLNVHPVYAPLVPVEVVRLREPLVAHAALEGRLLRVGPHVRLVVGPVVGHPAADGTVLVGVRAGRFVLGPAGSPIELVGRRTGIVGMLDFDLQQ